MHALVCGLVVIVIMLLWATGALLRLSTLLSAYGASRARPSRGDDIGAAGPPEPGSEGTTPGEGETPPGPDAP
jgi:hypothetical protein